MLPELFVWWISLVTPLTEGCAQSFDSSGTLLLPPPYGSQQVLIRFLPSAKNVARNDSGSRASLRTLRCSQRKIVKVRRRHKTEATNKACARLTRKRRSCQVWNQGITHFDTKSTPLHTPPPQLVQRKNAWRRNSHWSGELICFFLKSQHFKMSTARDPLQDTGYAFLIF